jgi:hypothetical protein
LVIIDCSAKWSWFVAGARGHPANLNPDVLAVPTGSPDQANLVVHGYHKTRDSLSPQLPRSSRADELPQKCFNVIAIGLGAKDSTRPLRRVDDRRFTRGKRHSKLALVDDIPQQVTQIMRITHLTDSYIARKDANQ